MKTRFSVRSRRFPVLFLFFMILAISPGCQKLKNLFVKPPSEEVIQDSYTVKMIGYEETVTVKTTPEQFLAFMSDPKRLAPGGIEVEAEQAVVGESGLPPLGTTIPLNVRRMGIEIKGRLIFAKLDPDQFWLIWDTPLLLQTQRWKFKPVKQGIRLNLRVETEVPQQGELVVLGQAVELVSKEIFEEIDLMLAQIQAHFDPSLSPQELVALGLRGEGYEALIQTNEARVWIDASPDRVRAWASDPENLAMALEELKVSEEDFHRFVQAPPETVVYAPAVLQMGAVKADVDAFVYQQLWDDGFGLRLYYVGSFNIGIIEVRAAAAAGGTDARARLVTEIPSSAYPKALEVMLYAAGAPQLLREKALMLKHEVEKSKTLSIQGKTYEPILTASP